MPKQSHYKMDFAYVSCTALPISKTAGRGAMMAPLPAVL